MARYIDAEWLKDELGDTNMDIYTDEVKEYINDAPSIDIVQCGECKHWVYNFNGCARNPCTEPWYATDFCNYGEREGER